MTDIARERLMFAQQGLDVIPRSTWSTQSYGSDRTVSEPVEGFFLHISVTIDHGDLAGDEHKDMRTIERIGNERFNGIGFPYNAAIFDTGHLYEGQPLTRRGAHTVNDENKPGFRETGSGGSLNYWYRAIVLPQMVTDNVTQAQVDQCARWAAAQIRAGYAKRNATWHGHRDVSAKSCPGDAGYARLPEIRKLTEHYVTNGLEGGLFVTEDDKTIMRNILKQEVPALVKAAVDDRFSTGGTATRQQIAGDEAGDITGLVELALQRSDQFTALEVKVDHIVEMLHEQEPVPPA